jgi:hypothetical protein
MLVYASCVIVLFVITLLLGARYLRYQRERMELSQNADGLRKVLRTLRKSTGTEDATVPVPVELLERTARIEQAQIATERKDAVLESMAFRANAYAVTFEPDATAARAALDIADRLELEDLVAELSTEGRLLSDQSTGGATGALQCRTGNNRIVVDCLVDRERQSIRIVGVRHDNVATRAASGASHA